MRTALIVALLIAVAAPAAGSVEVGARDPTLHVIDTQPFRVRGMEFRAGERARVVLSVEDVPERVRSARANARGSFVVSFGAVGIGRCKGWSIAAIGQRGSRAQLALAAPMCNPQ